MENLLEDEIKETLYQTNTLMITQEDSLEEQNDPKSHNIPPKVEIQLNARMVIKFTKEKTENYNINAISLSVGDKKEQLINIVNEAQITHKLTLIQTSELRALIKVSKCMAICREMLEYLSLKKNIG